MPKVSRDSAPQRQEDGPIVDLRDELDGYTVSFTSLLEDIDATPLLKGLPDDRCQCPHWGYVFKGRMTARYVDRDEVFEVGEAFYTPPGHIPVENEPGTEILWFSPSEELRTAEAVMMKNMQAMQEGSTSWARRRAGSPSSGRRPCCIQSTPAAARVEALDGNRSRRFAGESWLTGSGRRSA